MTKKTEPMHVASFYGDQQFGANIWVEQHPAGLLLKWETRNPREDTTKGEELFRMEHRALEEFAVRVRRAVYPLAYKKNIVVTPQRKVREIRERIK